MASISPEPCLTDFLMVYLWHTATFDQSLKMCVCRVAYKKAWAVSERCISEETREEQTWTSTSLLRPGHSWLLSSLCSLCKSFKIDWYGLFSCQNCVEIPFMLWQSYAYWSYGVFKKMGVPGPSPVPFFGTMLAYRNVSCTNIKRHNITRYIILHDNTEYNFCTKSNTFL